MKHRACVVGEHLCGYVHTLVPGPANFSEEELQVIDCIVGDVANMHRGSSTFGLGQYFLQPGRVAGRAAADVNKYRHLPFAGEIEQRGQFSTVYTLADIIQRETDTQGARIQIGVYQFQNFLSLIGYPARALKPGPLVGPQLCVSRSQPPFQPIIEGVLVTWTISTPCLTRSLAQIYPAELP